MIEENLSSLDDVPFIFPVLDISILFNCSKVIDGSPPLVEAEEALAEAATAAFTEASDDEDDVEESDAAAAGATTPGVLACGRWKLDIFFREELLWYTEREYIMN